MVAFGVYSCLISLLRFQENNPWYFIWIICQQTVPMKHHPSFDESNKMFWNTQDICVYYKSDGCNNFNFYQSKEEDKKIRNTYNQIRPLTQDSIWESEKTQETLWNIYEAVDVSFIYSNFQRAKAILIFLKDRAFLCPSMETDLCLCLRNIWHPNLAIFGALTHCILHRCRCCFHLSIQTASTMWLVECWLTCWPITRSAINKILINASLYTETDHVTVYMVSCPLLYMGKSTPVY